MLLTKKLILEGHWRQGKIFKGIELRAHSIYRGEFKNNKKDGNGICNWLNGEEYVGEWKSGFRHGTGQWSSKDKEETYSG